MGHFTNFPWKRKDKYILNRSSFYDIFLNIFLQIEEEIEEITEFVSDTEQDSSCTVGKSVTKSGPYLSNGPLILHSSVDCILAELNSTDGVENLSERQVPFPEFGVDIVLHHKHGKL